MIKRRAGHLGRGTSVVGLGEGGSEGALGMAAVGSGDMIGARGGRSDEGKESGGEGSWTLWTLNVG